MQPSGRAWVWRSNWWSWLSKKVREGAAEQDSLTMGIELLLGRGYLVSCPAECEMGISNVSHGLMSLQGLECSNN